MFEVPVLLIGFNRPKFIKKQLDVLRGVAVRSLYISIDAPRESNSADITKVDEVKRVVEQNCDWEVEVFYNYAKQNLGCGPGPVSGIDWFFSHVEEGIILEDDCIPDHSFFPYCLELLDRYRDENRVMTISGSRFPVDMNNLGVSYTFSSYAHIWGWATWRRAWKLFDFEVSTYGSTQYSETLERVLGNKRAIHEWDKCFASVYGEDKNTVWDYQWMLASWMNQGLSIHPKNNLIENIGFGEDSTHTQDRDKSHSLQVESIVFPLRHPDQVEVDKIMDSRIQEQIFTRKGWLNDLKYSVEMILPEPVISMLKKIKKGIGQ